MQKTATRVFICASIAFGIAGILMILTLPPDGVDAHSSVINTIFRKLVFISVFTILPSFALSVAGKYLKQ
jgi:Na+/H+ antiporter NhaA